LGLQSAEADYEEVVSGEADLLHKLGWDATLMTVVSSVIRQLVDSSPATASAVKF
jgi:hypothetical protein